MVNDPISSVALRIPPASATGSRSACLVLIESLTVHSPHHHLHRLTANTIANNETPETKDVTTIYHESPSSSTTHHHSIAGWRSAAKRWPSSTNVHPQNRMTVFPSTLVSYWFWSAVVSRKKLLVVLQLPCSHCWPLCCYIAALLPDYCLICCYLP
jgi:hypothetical protein